ncbi:MAG TPA: hypothetical protein VIM14_06045, partial [Polyangia bacterium]
MRTSELRQSFDLGQGPAGDVFQVDMAQAESRHSRIVDLPVHPTDICAETQRMRQAVRRMHEIHEHVSAAVVGGSGIVVRRNDLH